ncbi:MAG: hypothetical protein F7B20_03535 [Aeropyrum sp.]|nr:hypothetical protein [Aeropyrum sp.]MCE4615636.1 hypothetical protein [Aeropyrum sp.]
MEHSICLRMSIDPSTPISSVLEALGEKPKVIVVPSETPISLALEECMRESCEFIKVEGENEFVAPSHELVKRVRTEGKKPISTLANEAIPSFDSYTSIQDVITTLILHGGDAAAITEDGRILSVVTLKTLSKVIALEIDVEELRGAD